MVKLSEMTEKECVNGRHPALDREKSNCATLRGHVSNSYCQL